MGRGRESGAGRSQETGGIKCESCFSYAIKLDLPEWNSHFVLRNRETQSLDRELEVGLYSATSALQPRPAVVCRPPLVENSTGNGSRSGAGAEAVGSHKEEEFSSDGRH